MANFRQNPYQRTTKSATRYIERARQTSKCEDEDENENEVRAPIEFLPLMVPLELLLRALAEFYKIKRPTWTTTLPTNPFCTHRVQILIAQQRSPADTPTGDLVFTIQFYFRHRLSLTWNNRLNSDSNNLKSSIKWYQTSKEKFTVNGGRENKLEIRIETC